MNCALRCHRSADQRKRVGSDDGDHGQKFDPAQDTSLGLSSAIEKTPALAARGLHLIETFADRMHYEHSDGKNRLTLEHDRRPEAQ